MTVPGQDPSAVVVEAARGEDLRALARLERSSFPHPWSAELLAQELAATGGRTLVVRKASCGEILGYLSLRIFAQDAEILRLAVAPGHRRRGLGLLLVVRALELMRAGGVERCFLEVRRDNHPALGLYGRLGFRPLAHRPRYYPDGGPAAVLGVDLQPA